MKDTTSKDLVLEAARLVDETPRCLSSRFWLNGRIVNYLRFNRIEFDRIHVLKEIDRGSAPAFYFSGIVIFLHQVFRIDVSATVLEGRLDSFSFLAHAPGVDVPVPLPEGTVRQFIVEQLSAI